MKKYFKVILLLGISFIFLTGCAIDLVVPENDVNSPATEGSSIDENPIGGLGTGKGTLKIYLTDAPGDYEEVNINISRIEGHIAVEDEEGYWEILKEWKPDDMEVNLIELEDVSILLGSLQLAPNKYTQLRIFLKEDASLVLEGEGGLLVTEPLEIPSSANTGIKLNHPFEIIEGMITKLTIDFDAEKSVIKTGNGKYKMKPVIGLSSETYSAEELPDGAGSVSGSVSYYQSVDGELILTKLEGAKIKLTLTGSAYIFTNTTITSTEEPIGEFSFLGVPVGTYTLNVYDVEGYDDYSQNIEVIDETNTSVDVVLLSGGISGVVKEYGSESTFIGGETVTVALSGDNIFISSANTNGNGEFVFEQLPVGIYYLTISATGYYPYSDITPSGEIEVTAGEITDVGTIGLTPTP